MIPIVNETVRPAGIGTYGIGCMPEFDAETMVLTIDPGVMRVLRGPGEEGRGPREEFVFPGGEVQLPPETTEVHLGRRRIDGQPAIIVNVGKGIDDVTYEINHRVLMLGDVGWVLSHWRCNRLDLPRWSQSKYGAPPDPAQFRGDPAEVVVVNEYPPHLRASIERQKMREEAALRLGVLTRKSGKWSDEDKEAALRDLIALSDIELL